MIGAFILSIGQETERESVNAIVRQQVHFRLIKNIKPVNRAMNRCFESAERWNLSHFVILGADTIHVPHSLETLQKYASEHENEPIWCIWGRLEDYYQGSEVYGNHFYIAQAVRGYRFDETDPIHDHLIHHDMEAKGYKKIITREVIGKHHPTWTVKEAFEKHLFSGRRYDEETAEKYLANVEKRYEENPCDVNRAAVDGFKLGISTNTIKRTLSFGMTPEWKEHKHNYDPRERLNW